ncbi:hypothetical protein BJV77DRAFT_1057951 [Russula vinacea]|nr:hypothetical protein BJV77DRAFT_1057951 [Russula vinacea]
MGQFSLLKYIQDQWQKPDPAEHVDLTGKTVVVIGANVGLGFEAAKHFASMNPKRLVLGCRSQEKGQAALQAIQATGFKDAELALVDLARFALFIRDSAQIDIFVYNAGVQVTRYSASKDGWEESIQVNHLSAMMLTILLLPCLLKAASSGTSPNPRVVIVSSDVHYWTKFSKTELESDKLLYKIILNVFFVRELTKRLPANSPVIVTAVNPGYCKSQLRRDLPVYIRTFDRIMEIFLARTAEEGSRNLVWAAVGGAGREFELRGAYVSYARLEEVSDYALSDEGAVVQTRLWDESVEVLSGVEPKIESSLREILSS